MTHPHKPLLWLVDTSQHLSTSSGPKKENEPSLAESFEIWAELAPALRTPQVAITRDIRHYQSQYQNRWQHMATHGNTWQRCQNMAKHMAKHGNAVWPHRFSSHLRQNHSQSCHAVSGKAGDLKKQSLETSTQQEHTQLIIIGVSALSFALMPIRLPSRLWKRYLFSDWEANTDCASKLATTAYHAYSIHCFRPGPKLIQNVQYKQGEARAHEEHASNSFPRTLNKFFLEQLTSTKCIKPSNLIKNETKHQD